MPREPHSLTRLTPFPEVVLRVTTFLAKVPTPLAPLSPRTGWVCRLLGRCTKGVADRRHRVGFEA